MGNICIIGPRGAGKTTYLAALAYCFQGKNKPFQITAITEDAKKLAGQAERIILEGLPLEPTRIGSDIPDVYALPSYSFKIERKRWRREPDEIDLVVRDYPGEIFDELDAGIYNNVQQEFLDECLIKDVVGCLILLHKWDGSADKFYSGAISKFVDLMDKQDRSGDLRLAVAMSKCERGEIWPGRLEAETDIFEVHLPTTTSMLRQKIPEKNLQFYALSTFGVIKRNDPRPNRIDDGSGASSILRYRGRGEWRPYGMVSPLYRLSKGKRMRSGV